LAVVVVVLGVVVDVVPLAVVVVVPGLVVDVTGGSVVAVVVAVVAVSAFKTARMTVLSALATLAPFGRKATVISSVDWVKRTVRTSPLWVVPELEVAVGHTFATSSPVLPESGVPAGHFAPSVKTGPFGSPTEVAVSFNPEYSEAKRPRVAFAPASAELLGWIWITPLPEEYKPRVRLCSVGMAARVFGELPQRSKTRPATQWSLVVGATTCAVTGCRRS
jgi:hypothetical protein